MNSLSKCVLSILRYKSSCPVTIISTKVYRVFSSTTTQGSMVPHPNSVRKLQELFNLRKLIAYNILLEHKKLAECSANEINQTFNSLIDAGITKGYLKKHIAVLGLSNVNEKICLLKELPYTINDTVPLLLLNIKLLYRFVNQEKTQNRIRFFSELLKISVDEVCNLISVKTFLITLEFEHIQKCYNVLTKYGISHEDILKDLWVLKYSIENIQNRLRIANDSHIENIKTWMVRAPPDVFENCIKRKSDNKSILGKKSFIEYLSHQLQCSQELAKYIIYKHPAIQNKSLKKINEMVDFLISSGFNTVHICRTPKILLHSKDTVNTRLKILQNQGTHLNSLCILTKSKTQFTKFLDQLIQKKVKKIEI